MPLLVLASGIACSWHLATEALSRVELWRLPSRVLRQPLTARQCTWRHAEGAKQLPHLRHDGNPVLAWCLGNVVGKADRRGNLYPTRRWPEQKIDAAVALLMAVGRAMADDGSAAGLEGFLAGPLFADLSG